jgi:hypothetical protein
MPRFGGAADETGQHRTAELRAVQSTYCTQSGLDGASSAQDTLQCGGRVESWVTDASLSLSLACPLSLLLSAVVRPLGHAGSGQTWPVGLMNCPPTSYGLPG